MTVPLQNLTSIEPNGITPAQARLDFCVAVYQDFHPWQSALAL